MWPGTAGEHSPCCDSVFIPKHDVISWKMPFVEGNEPGYVLMRIIKALDIF